MLLLLQLSLTWVVQAKEYKPVVSYIRKDLVSDGQMGLWNLLQDPQMGSTQGRLSWLICITAKGSVIKGQ